MSGRLSGRAAVVTGASRGIGPAIAGRLLDAVGAFLARDDAAWITGHHRVVDAGQSGLDVPEAPA